MFSLKICTPLPLILVTNFPLKHIAVNMHISTFFNPEHQQVKHNNPIIYCYVCFSNKDVFTQLVQAPVVRYPEHPEKALALDC